MGCTTSKSARAAAMLAKYEGRSQQMNLEKEQAASAAFEASQQSPNKRISNGTYCTTNDDDSMSASDTDCKGLEGHKAHTDQLLAQGRYGQAMEVHKKVLERRQAKYGDDSELVADSYCDMAHCYQLEGQLELALRYYQQAKKRRGEILTFEGNTPEDHLKMAQVCDSVGEVYLLLKKPHDARVHHQLALLIHNDKLLTSHKSLAVAKIQYHLGEAFYKLHDYNEAMTALEKSLVGYETCPEGATSAEMAECYSLLGLVAQHLQLYDKSFLYHELALMSVMTSDGPMHTVTYRSNMSMGLCRKEQGQVKDAIKFLHASLMAQIAAHDGSENHLETAECLVAIAECFYQTRHVDEALVYYHRAEAALLNSVGEMTPETQAIYSKLQKCYKKKNDEQRAHSYKQKSHMVKKQLSRQRESLEAASTLVAADGSPIPKRSSMKQPSSSSTAGVRVGVLPQQSSEHSNGSSSSNNSDGNDRPECTGRTPRRSVSFEKDSHKTEPTRMTPKRGMSLPFDASARPRRSSLKMSQPQVERAKSSSSGMAKRRSSVTFQD